MPPAATTETDEMPPAGDDGDNNDGRVVAVRRQARGGVAMVKPVHAYSLLIELSLVRSTTHVHACDRVLSVR